MYIIWYETTSVIYIFLDLKPLSIILPNNYKRPLKYERKILILSFRKFVWQNRLPGHKSEEDKLFLAMV